MSSVPAPTYPPRLPSSVRPYHYDLCVIPDFTSFTFQGQVRISIEVTEATAQIVLNSAEMTYPDPRVTIEPAGPKFVDVTLDDKSERATFSFDSAVAPGFYYLSINFLGTLNDHLCGFYRSSYKKPDGSKSWLAVTQFEATDARRAFPCVDEPAVKATFDFTVLCADNLVAVSNMPVKRKEYVAASTDASEASKSRGLSYSAGLVRWEFLQTPVMSTYLLAYIVGEFEFISGFTKDNVSVSVYTPIGKVNEGRFALDTAIRALERFNDYFGVPYPLPKSDLVAIPDFAAGAMENWGLVTYRENALLVDEKNAAIARKQRIANVVSHELSHMWFGNYVTMEWWTYLWLNEGFARFSEYQSVAALFPEWKMWNDFVSSITSSALTLDSLTTSHPIEVPVKYSYEVNEIFDTISYAKGASVLRMLHATIGDEAWRAGVKNYMNRFAYKNTVTEDLWGELSKASGKDVAKLMDQWLKIMGFPVVAIEEIPSNAAGKRSFKVQQQRFFASMEGRTSDADPSIWTIPISASSADGKAQDTVWFDQREGEISLALPAGPIFFNIEQTGFYRIRLSAALFDSIRPHLMSLSPIQRLGIQRDVYTLAVSGLTPMSPALDLFPVFKAETNYHSLVALSSSLASLRATHCQTSYYPALQKYSLSLLRSQLDRLSFQPKAGEDPSDGLLRATIIADLASCGDEGVLKHCREALAAFHADPAANPIPAEITSAVFGAAMRKGGWAAHEMLKDIYKRSVQTDDKLRALANVGLVTGSGPDDQKILDDAIRFAFSEDVRTSEVVYVMGSICASTVGASKAWEFFKANWDMIISRFGVGQNFLIAGLFSAVLSAPNSEAAADEFEQWFKDHPVATIVRTVKQAVETVRFKAARLKRETKEVEGWLKANGF